MCQLRLMGKTFQTKCLVEKLASEDINKEALALKIRRFFVPVLALMGSSEGPEPEVVKLISELVRSPEVKDLLQDFRCEKDEIPLVIDNSLIPTVLQFSEDNEFLQVKSLGKTEEKDPVDTIGVISEHSAKELVLRRCASADSLKTNTPFKEEVALRLLAAANESMAHDINRMLIEDDIEKYYINAEDIIISEDFGLSAEASPSSPSKQFYLPSTSVNLLLSGSIRSAEEEKTIKGTNELQFHEFNDIVGIEVAPIKRGEWSLLHYTEEHSILVKPVRFSKTFFMVKSFGVIEFPSKTVTRALLKHELRKEWDRVLCPEPVSVINKDEPILYYSVDSGIGLFPRDFVVRRTHTKKHPSGCTVIYVKSTENNEKKPIEDKIRGKIHSGGVVIRPLNENSTNLTVVLKIDLNILVPRKILFSFYKEKLIEWYAQLRNGCAKLKGN